MNEYISTQSIIKEMNKQVLNGAKIPHHCSLPVLRKKGDTYVIALFIQLFTRNQLNNQVMQRPAYWCYANIQDGSDFTEYSCKEREFCTAPYDCLYKKGTVEKDGTLQDISNLYKQMDIIRMKYIEYGILDVISYNQYLRELFKLIPNGQINFYKELSRIE